MVRNILINNMILDEGYLFGLGAFETIAIEDNVPILLKKHLNRLERALKYFDIKKTVTEEDVFKYLDTNPMEHGVLKIIVSNMNVIFSKRDNLYNEEVYKKGFRLGFSEVLRNDTSPLTFHKTLNYGDCILENRNGKSKGFDELIFLNRKSEICEGTTTNIFFVKGSEIYTPKLSCGLLPGVLREFLLENEIVSETVINKHDIYSFDQCFVTNSLLGIMPVVSLDDKLFTSRSIAEILFKKYLDKFSVRLKR